MRGDKSKGLVEDKGLEAVQARQVLDRVGMMELSATERAPAHLSRLLASTA